MRCTKAIISRENLEFNYKNIKKIVSQDTKICVAVKADAYGHGAVETARELEKLGVDYLAVASFEEGLELRENGIKASILLLSLCTPEDFINLFKYEITPLVFGKEFISLLDACAKSYFSCNERFSVYLAVDTGMGRIGCFPKDCGEEAKLISESSHLKLEGMATHMALSDSVSCEGISYTKQQGEAFKKAVENVKKMGLNPGILSAGSSACAINWPDLHFDMVRPGIIVYGYYPDEITRDYLLSKNVDFQLKPVMTFQTKVVAVRHFKKGMSVSYGRTWICEKDTCIGVLPVGYADGLLRRFSPGLKIFVNGKAYPVVGRICMDQCMIDLGDDSDVKPFDDALIFGDPSSTGCMQTAEDLALLGKTISYEVLTCVSKRVKRFWQ